MEEFWEEENERKRYYRVEKDRHSTFSVSHKDALIILEKMKSESDDLIRDNIWNMKKDDVKKQNLERSYAFNKNK